MNPKQKKFLWIAGIVLAVFYFAPAFINSYRRAAYIRQIQAARMAQAQAAQKTSPLPGSSSAPGTGTSAGPGTLDRNSWPAHYGMTQMYLATGKQRKAEEHLKRLKALVEPEEFEDLKNRLGIERRAR